MSELNLVQIFDQFRNKGSRMSDLHYTLLLALENF